MNSMENSLASSTCGTLCGVVSSHFQQVSMKHIFIVIVGYGDIYPVTTLGKVVCVFIMFWGNFIMSLLIVALANMVEFDRNEAKAYFQIDNELAIISSFNTASDLIKSFFRYLVIKKREAEAASEDIGSIGYK